ncbi:MAG: chorismate synthase [Bacteroidales bacterium]|jgi:chorismate synthase|nr:chorismate synthase [Bacteroidales bacterium]
MGANTIGCEFALTTFGESHGVAIGGIIDGCPSNLTVDMAFIDSELQRRKTQNEFGTARIEQDKVVFFSGLEQNITLGTPIGFMIENKDIRPEDYQDLEHFRSNHADYTYLKKYGIKPLSGGGRASARETAARVVGGSIAKLFLQRFDIRIEAKIEAIGGINYLQNREEAERLLQAVKQAGDSIGGKIVCRIENCPSGLGEPVFDKFSALLAQAMISIPSAMSFEIGGGLSTAVRGSESMAGGLQGGISNGQSITFSVGFKPISSYNCKGRHDVCQLFRATVIVESMAALVTADLMKRNYNLGKI